MSQRNFYGKSHESGEFCGAGKTKKYVDTHIWVNLPIKCINIKSNTNQQRLAIKFLWSSLLYTKDTGNGVVVILGTAQFIF